MKAVAFIMAPALCLAASVGAANAQDTGAKLAQAPATTIVNDGPPDTLMFSVDELTDIQGRVVAGAGGESGGDGSGVENASLYLSTIVFYGPQDWTAWINGAPINPRQDFQSFRVTDIGPDFVELVIPHSAQGMRPVRLAPNQTFIARTGSVVEGKWKP